MASSQHLHVRWTCSQIARVDMDIYTENTTRSKFTINNDFFGMPLGSDMDWYTPKFENIFVHIPIYELQRFRWFFEQRPKKNTHFGFKKFIIFKWLRKTDVALERWSLSAIKFRKSLLEGPYITSKPGSNIKLVAKEACNGDMRYLNNYFYNSATKGWDWKYI